MLSIAPPSFPSTNPHKFAPTGAKFASPLSRSSSSICSPHSPVCCRCLSGGADPSQSGDGSSWRWDLTIQDAFKNVMKRFDDFVNLNRNHASVVGAAETTSEEKDEEWDWERWKKHFSEVEEQERIVSILKSQLAGYINREDYEGAARLKVAIAAAATNDTVGKVKSHFNNTVEEERYSDAAWLRDYAGAGLVGWWVGVSEGDPYGRIIRISAEYGRYVAKSYTPRQLASAMDGAPIFEIFLTMNKKDEYRLQAVYLKRTTATQDLTIPSSKVSGAASNLDSRSPTENKNDLFGNSSEVSEDDEDSDDDSGFGNALQDLIPGVKVKVLKVTAPAKVDRDLISKVIEDIIEDEDEDEEGEEDIKETDSEIESIGAEEEIKDKSDIEHNAIEMDSDRGVRDGVEQNQIALKVVVSGLVQNMSSNARSKDFLRVPARLERKGRLSFTFTIEEDDKQTSGASKQSPRNRSPKLQGQRSIDHLMLDLAKFIGRGKIPMKVLKDVSELFTLTLNQARNPQPLSKSTTFNRIEIPTSQDPLNGLYVGTHGLRSSEVIHLRRRFGQWKEDGITKQSSRIEFYEYVEAVKLTGDPYVPAGQIAFRAKVGKQYQLPHKGIFPEEFGVIARYKGQGRLAEPGFQNPRWVDGELVILDGKYIKGGPVIGFVYWATEYHFLVFFHRLRLQE
ncbi:PREDICTED: protein EXECUTER 1, chloroplastic-like [Ipomoea nil]|uniref:protein EXECUTER 1, chloroplastic-like n=1 Tax=Ipomoea nil TaxID=35883 RepID=UPI000901D289|nr:PREDICTED: protein EXECUTER 1, chloroplastic-like [Ipomoea nil]